MADAEFAQAGEFEYGQESRDELPNGDGPGEERGESKGERGAHVVEEPLHAVGDRNLLVLDLADDEFLGEAAEDEVKGVPEVDTIGGLEGAIEFADAEFGNVAGEQVLLEGDELVELVGGFLEFFVLEELVDEFPPRIHGVVVIGAVIHGGVAAGKEETALNLHQGSGHDEELAGDLEVELLQGAQDIEVLFGDRLDGDVIDIDLVFPDEEKEEVERAFKDRQFDAIIGVGKHGSGKRKMTNDECRMTNTERGTRNAEDLGAPQRRIGMRRS